MPWAVAAAAVAAGGSYLASSNTASAAKKAASTQSQAADQAAQMQKAQFDQTQANLSPYRDLGQTALPYLSPGQYQNPAQATAGNQYGGNVLQQAYGELPYFENPNGGMVPDSRGYAGAAPGSMGQQELEQTPGYQFTRDQGLQAVQNSAAARGLGVSGAALKGAATFATGLADKTYQDQFAIKQQQFANQGALFGAQQQQFGDNLALNQNAFGQAQQRQGDLLNLNTANQASAQNSYNRLTGIAGIGQNAATGVGQMGAASAGAQGNYLTSGANATGAGLIAQGNATAGSYNGLANAAGKYFQGVGQGVYSNPVDLYGKYFGSSSGSSTGSGSGSSPFDGAGQTASGMGL